jgi:hypothetical protein
MTFDEKDKTKYVPRDQWPGYFETAKECHTCMHNEYRDGRYRSAGLSAIQTVISAGDAVLISQTGQTPGNHHFAASMLGKQFTSPEGKGMVKAYSNAYIPFVLLSRSYPSVLCDRSKGNDKVGHRQLALSQEQS